MVATPWRIFSLVDGFVSSMTTSDPLTALIALFLGFLLLVLGIVLLALGRLASSGGEVRSAGVVVIGPVPLIIRGSGARVAALLLAVFAGFLVLLIYLATLG
jgi:uncharacterized membrane protein